MKKILATFILVLLMAATLSGCNRQIIDTTYNFGKVIIYLPDGQIVEGKVENWLDYENSDQIQVKIDGVIYLVHSSNIVLIKE